MKLCAQAWRIHFEDNLISHGSIQFPISYDNYLGLPMVNFSAKRPQAMVVAPVSGFITPTDSLNAFHPAESPHYIEHRRLGHIGRDDLLDLAKGGNLAYDYATLKNDDFKLSDCSACQQASSTRQSRKGESPRGSADGELVHVDLTGRLQPSVKGNEYALIMIADFTKVRSVVHLARKSDALRHVEGFVIRLQRQSDIKVKTIRSDRGTEFSLAAFCACMGINHQTTPGHAPEFNGVAERNVGHI